MHFQLSLKHVSLILEALVSKWKTYALQLFLKHIYLILGALISKKKVHVLSTVSEAHIFDFMCIGW